MYVVKSAPTHGMVTKVTPERLSGTGPDKQDHEVG